MKHMPRGLIRFVSRAFLLMVLILATEYLHADQDASRQLWGNIILCYPKSDKLYFEVDFEPKIQFSGAEEWWNLDAVPLVEYYVSKWIDLTAESVFGYTRQRNRLRSFELSPKIGIRLHLLSGLREYLTWESIQKRQISLANLLRIEYRNLFYFGDLESTSEWRLRNRLEFKFPINNVNLSIDRTLYIMADGELYIPLIGQISESFASKARIRAGLGYRVDYKWRIELLYIQDWAKDTIEEGASVNVAGIDLRIKLFY